MTYMVLDDGLLDHPKFIRAEKLAGSEAIHLWLGLRAYCAVQLTDGYIPSDMIDEVRGPRNLRKRAAALDALRTVGLVDEAPGGVTLHDYLDHAKSKAQVLEQRESARKRQAKSRVSHAVTPASVTLPPPIPSDPLQSNPLPADPNTNTQSLEVDVDDRETICPADIVERLEAAGVFRELAGALRVEEDPLRDEARRSAGYWTVGAGAGQRRRHWVAKFRQWLVDKASSGELHSAARTALRPLAGTRAGDLLEHQQQRIRELKREAEAEAVKALP